MSDTKSKLLFWMIGLSVVAWSDANALPTGGEHLKVTAARGLHLRSDAGRGHRSLDLLSEGEDVVTTGRTRRGWTEVRAQGRRGWVKSDYLTEASYCTTCGANPDPENPLLAAGRAVARKVFSGALSYAKKLGRYFYVGHRVESYKCWRAVWNVLKRAGLVSGDMTQDLAKNAFKDLRKFGFHHDPRACKTPGVVRVYGGAQPGYGTDSPGDYAGHIETLGEDGFYHHFTKSPKPMNERVGNKTRPLKYCLIK